MTVSWAFTDGEAHDALEDRILERVDAERGHFRERPAAAAFCCARCGEAGPGLVVLRLAVGPTRLCRACREEMLQAHMEAG